MSPDVLNDLKRCKADAMRGQDAGRQLIYTRAIDEIERLRALVMLGDFSGLRPNSDSFKLVQQIRRERSTGEQKLNSAPERNETTG